MELIIGSIGAFIVLFFFLLAQFRKVDTESFIYDFGNALGSLLLLIYGISLSSIPFIIVNSIWFVFSIKDVILRLVRLPGKYNSK